MVQTAVQIFSSIDLNHHLITAVNVSLCEVFSQIDHELKIFLYLQSISFCQQEEFIEHPCSWWFPKKRTPVVILHTFRSKKAIVE